MKAINIFILTWVFALITILLSINCIAQPVNFINNGSVISNTGVAMIIKGHVYNDLNGSITNSGNIHVTGQWYNNNSGNNVFSAGTNGWIRMEGANQTIGGSNFTKFNNLELAGSGIKKLDITDVEIEDTLALNDREFDAGNNTVYVKNPGTGVITRNNVMTGGFVSSSGNGGLSRTTTATSAYSFPVGSSTGTLRFRPVELTPNSNSQNTFKVRFANVNPTSETYDITLKDDSICEVNSNFYHRIYHTNGTSATDIKIYYDPVTDGNFQTIAHWQNIPQWENTDDNDSASVSQFSSITKSGWTDFTTNSFALSKILPIATISTDPVCQGGNVIFIAPSGFANYDFFVNGISMQNGANNIYSSSSLSNSDSVKVVLYDLITCQSSSNNINPVLNPNPDITALGTDTISLGESATLTASGANSYEWQPVNQNGASINVSPEEKTIYSVIGTDINGCTDSATVTVYIDATCIHKLPNIFSPNGDGQNESFRVLGKNLDWISLTVFDRWGNKVFETEDVAGKWDGKYKGEFLNNGVFVYIMKGKCKNSDEIFDQHGNVTLTR